ncbi:WD40 repeat-like protein [Piromyces finnis]|uniref:WD40 repeat-like protein n=1 Tax=Piromyces finnis TaxID=1754191 RepID=A0A1Y1VH12_9FUNG|nr:WD40 repeat-like protein [Piromyces finnis]|eukprot:ORX54750.1 WD40 repeat-like protein [Piromyces finnis]
MFQKINDWLQRSSHNPSTGTVSSKNFNSSISSVSKTQNSSELEAPVISNIITSINDLSMNDTKSLINSAKDSAYETEIDVYGFINILPYELSINVLLQIDDIHTINKISQVSHKWNELANDNTVWHNLYEKRWGCLPDPIERRKIHNYKYLYKQRLRLNKNWVNLDITPKCISGHDDSVYCVQFDKNIIVSGSRDKSIKFWDIKTMECIKVLKYHKGSVLCLQYNDKIVVSGSSDSTLIVWDFKTGEVLKILSGKYGHVAPVLDVRFNDKVIVSCSKDCTIKIWDLESGNLIRTLNGHRAAVNAIHIYGDEVVSASGDCTIKLWNINTGECIREFIGHLRGLACVQYNGDIIASGSNDHTIKLWNAKTGQLIRTLSGDEGHKDLVRTLAFDNERIVSGSYDQTIKIWDIKTGKLLKDFKNAHGSWVFNVQMDASKIVSASQDRKIAIWDFTGDIHDVDTFLK